jgi:hypothetical protein
MQRPGLVEPDRLLDVHAAAAMLGLKYEFPSTLWRGAAEHRTSASEGRAEAASATTPTILCEFHCSIYKGTHTG